MTGVACKAKTVVAEPDLLAMSLSYRGASRHLNEDTENNMRRWLRC